MDKFDKIYEKLTENKINEAFVDKMTEWKDLNDMENNLISYAVHLGVRDNENLRNMFQDKLQNIIKYLNKIH